MASAPVSPVARRAPGHGAWGHEPLTGAQVRLLAVTASRVAVLTLDRDVGGPHVYRPLQVEIDVTRDDVRGVAIGPLRPSRRFTIVLTGGRSWPLEVTTLGRRHWGAVVDVLGEVRPDVPAGGHARTDAPHEGQVVSPDARA